jgi:hypothetical protein
MNKIPRAFISGMLILSGSLSVFAGNLPSSQCLDSTGGAPALQVDVSTGNYSVSSDSNQFGGSQILVNGINVLQYSQPGFVGPDSRGFSRTVNNLQFTVDFTRGRGPWLGISLSVRNVGASDITLNSVQLFGSSYAQAFNGGSLSQLQMYTESFTPSNPDGAQPVPGQTVNSLYYAALFIPGYARAWFFAYSVPALWSSGIQADGTGQTVTALQQFYGRPFPLSPGEQETFDTLYISNAYSLIDGLEAYGEFYTPRTPIERAGIINGYNPWNYFRQNIPSSTTTPVLNTIGSFAATGSQTGRPFLKYFILDDGWYVEKGNWTFDPTKYPEGAAGWAQKVRAQGLVPGLWVAPTQVATANYKGYTTLGGSSSQGYTVDPSNPAFQQDIFSQIRTLYAAGFRYFKTDFLRQAYIDYTQGNYFQYSKYPPERVMRDFMIGLRQAVGEDSYWLACNSVIEACAGLSDASRVGNDIAVSFNTVLTLVPNNSARFWMHDKVWLSDEDFTVIEESTFFPSFTPTTSVPGFSADEARTWCAYVVLTGGPSTWSDDPIGTTVAGFDLVKRTMLNAGGHGALPLDIETTRLPTKWVRREWFGTYIGLFNWSSSSATVEVTAADIPELRQGEVVTDVLTDAQYPIGAGGALAVSLNEHQSACLFLPRFPGIQKP